MIESSGWTPVWAMPNVTLDDPIEASLVALVNCHDQRLREVAGRHSALQTFLNAFRNEFGTPICPTIGMVRESARQNIKTTAAFGGFRDAVCMSAVIFGQGMTLSSKTNPIGIVHSDAFDVYPWFPTPQMDGRISVVTPALAGTELVDRLQPQQNPALGNRQLLASQIDQPLLSVVLKRWERCFAGGNEGVEDRRLFRALDMARAASRTPGGADASEHDAGRSAALWVSAFEILTHDGNKADLKGVLSRLNSVQWLSSKLKAQDRGVRINKKETVPTNLAGEIYGRLYRVRCDFLHGEPVTAKTLKLEKSGRQVQWFAASLFRLALTAFLDLRFSEAVPNDSQGLGHFIATRIDFSQAQRISEDAILLADEPAA